MIRYAVVLASIIAALFLGIFLGSPTAKKVLQPAPFDIHYVNYRGRTDIDLGFEEYLKANAVNYKITYHDAQRDPERLKQIAIELQTRAPDLIVTFGTTTTLSVFGSYKKPQNTQSPGVFTLVTSPVLANIVPNFASSLRNITGTVHVSPLDNQVRLMLAYRPVKKVGMLYTPTEINSIVMVDEMKQLAKTHGFELTAIPFNAVDGKPNANNAKAAIAQMGKLGVGWLYLPPDTHLGTVAKDVVIPEAHSHGIPTFASTEQLMYAGATFGLLSSYYELGIVAAQKAYEILVNGRKPQDIPIDRPPRFLRKVNPEAAVTLGFKNLIENIHLVEPVDVDDRQRTR